MDASGVNRIQSSGPDLWCSTIGGVLLFDLGDSSFTQYINDLDFRSSDVSAVAVDGRGSIWVGFVSTGITRIDDPDGMPSVEAYGYRSGDIVSDSITCLAASENIIYYGSTRGAAVFYDGIHSREPVLSDSLSDRLVLDMLLEGDTLWAAYDAGVASFDRNTFVYRSYPVGRTFSMCRHGNYLYIAGESGIMRFNGEEWSAVPKADTGTPIFIASGGGELAYITEAGAYLRSGDTWTDITGNMKQLFLESYRIRTSVNLLRTIAIDENGTPWVGGFWDTARRGTYISWYKGGEWHNMAPSFPVQNEIIRLDTDGAGGLWTSSNHYGISYLSPDGRWTSYTKFRGDVGEEALSYYQNNRVLLFDSRGFLWVSALDFDLDRIDVNDPFEKEDDVWTHYALGEGTITSDNFLNGKEDWAGNRWFLSNDIDQTGGEWGINILSADGSGWLSVDPQTTPGMESGSVFDCTFSNDGTVYLALDEYGVQLWFTGGLDWPNLSNFGDDIWITIIPPDSLISRALSSVERLGDGSVWVGTASGLVRYKNGLIDLIPRRTSPGQKGLIGSEINDIELDGEDNLWVATEAGLNMIATGQIEPEAGYDIGAFTTEDYWAENLQDLYSDKVISPLPSQNCEVLKYDGLTNVLWIGTNNGLVRLDLTPEVGLILPLSDMILYPNPIYASQGHNSLRIGRISGNVDIQVFTTEGELVHEARGISEDGEAWDLLTLQGFLASSGIYIVRVSDGSRSDTRKVAVIR